MAGPFLVKLKMCNETHSSLFWTATVL